MSISPIRMRIVLPALCSLVATLGCGGSGDEAADTASKYRPRTAEASERDESSSEGDSDSAREPALSGRSDDRASVAGGTSGGGQSGGTSTPSGGASGGASLSGNPGGSPAGNSGGAATSPPGDTPGSAGASGSTLILPPAVSGATLDSEQYEIPEGDTNTLLAFLRRMDARARSAATVEEQVKIQEVMLAAFDRALVPGLDETLRVQMTQQKAGLLRGLASVAPDRHEATYLSLLEQLRSDPNPQVALFAVAGSIEFRLVQFRRQPDDTTFEALEREMLALVRTPGIGADIVQPIQMIVQDMFQIGERERGRRLLSTLAPVLIDSRNEDLRSVGNAFLDQLHMAQLDFDQARSAVFDDVPGAPERLVELTGQLLTERKPTPFLVEAALDAALVCEVTHRYEQAKAIYALVERLAGATDDTLAQTMAGNAARKADVRLNLIGKPLPLTGKLISGGDFDWSRYRGKVVLVAFWASSWGNSLGEFTTMVDLHQKYRDLGFEVVGVNVDDNVVVARQLLRNNPVTWENVVTDNPDRVGLDSPMAQQVGLAAAPFNLLVDRDGNIVEMHLYRFRDELERRVGTLLGVDPSLLPADPGPPGARQEGAAPADGEGAGEAPAEAAPTDPPTGTDDGMSRRVPKTEPRPEPSGWHWISVRSDGSQDPAVQDDQAEEDSTNPYLAPADASTDELVDFLLDLEDKPRSLLNRSGLVEAVVDAADRILADPAARPAHRRIAALEKLGALHRAAVDDDELQERLVAALDSVAAVDDPKVSDEVAFLRLEDETLAADESLDLAARVALLEKLKNFFTDRKLETRHLRLASASIAVVNDLSGDDPKQVAAEREVWFAAFGELFAKSKDRQLVAYGKRIAGDGASGAAAAGPAVGTPIEIAGTTHDGLPFDPAPYRGKVVVVDFWATWCGPCRKELPNVLQTHAELADRGFDVIGVSIDQDAEALTNFLAEEPLPWVTLAGAEAQQTAQTLGVRAIPTMMLLDREGKLVATAHRIGELRGEIDRLLAE
ncbi:MAG TPA: TlpA disulfide reductase family protein [Pirellulaceae bacterium]|nr:TlpA disulfide reductase family protein [Pirellulaceae bacterium]